MSQFRQVVPNSSVNTNTESFEFQLAWLAPSGVRSWLFSHTNGEEDEQFDNFILESTTNIRSVPVMDRIMVEATTRSLDLESFNYVKSIMKSNRVYVVGKDLTKTPIAVKGGSISKPNTTKEFRVSIKFLFKEEFILNV